jgi:hypothetical protein
MAVTQRQNVTPKRNGVLTQRQNGRHRETKWRSHGDKMGVTRRQNGGHAETKWRSRRDKMAVTRRQNGDLTQRQNDDLRILLFKVAKMDLG